MWVSPNHNPPDGTQHLDDRPRPMDSSFFSFAQTKILANKKENGASKAQVRACRRCAIGVNPPLFPLGRGCPCAGAGQQRSRASVPGGPIGRHCQKVAIARRASAQRQRRQVLLAGADADKARATTGDQREENHEREREKEILFDRIGPTRMLLLFCADCWGGGEREGFLGLE